MRSFVSHEAGILRHRGERQRKHTKVVDMENERITTTLQDFGRSKRRTPWFNFAKYKYTTKDREQLDQIVRAIKADYAAGRCSTKYRVFDKFQDPKTKRRWLIGGVYLSDISVSDEVLLKLADCHREVRDDSLVSEEAKAEAAKKADAIRQANGWKPKPNPKAAARPKDPARVAAAKRAWVTMRSPNWVAPSARKSGQQLRP